MRTWVRGLGGKEALASVLVLLFGACALANGAPIPHGTLELVAENPWVAAGRQFNLGLHFQLEKGWHIYWVNPGDSGEPPRVEWRLPGGITVAAIEWPTPQRFQSSTIVDYGYEDEVLLIAPLNVDAHLGQQASIQVGAAVKLLVCSHEMCVPGKAEISLTLPMRSDSHAPDARNGDIFAATRKSLPRRMPANWRLGVSQTSDSFVVTADLGHPIAGRTIRRAIFYPLVESQIENAAPQNLISQASGFQLTLRKSDQLVNLPERLKGVLVVSFGSSQPDQAYSVDAPIKHAAPLSPGDVKKRGPALGIRQNGQSLPIQSLKEEPQI